MTHLNGPFDWDDPDATRAFAAKHSFASIATVIDRRPAIAWAPLALYPDKSFRFHLSRNNPLVAHLDGALTIASVLGDHFYVSPDWYGTPDQVPTWNYELVEIEGIARRLDQVDLIDQVDALSLAHETRLAPKPAWSSAKMAPARFDAMAKAIVGFSIDAPSVRGIRKMNQNKNEAARKGVTEALRALGDEAAAAAMERSR